MELCYKLVVVIPFKKYRKGDVIYDQDIVNSIFYEKNAEMNQLKKHVRRLPCDLSDLGKMIEVKIEEEKQEPVVLEVSQNLEQSQDSMNDANQEESLEVQLSSVSGSESEEEATLPKSKRSKPLKGD